MSNLKNDRFIKALLRQPVDTTPVWMMRQAGRYLPEYRASRKKAGDFLKLCKTPEFACEVTLQPIDRYPLDAAILFSDILTIPDAMGLGLYFEEGEGPKFKKTIKGMADVQSLHTPDIAKDLGYVVDAVKLIKRELNNRVPLIGFSGSPWTLATYMIQGGGSKDFRKSKLMAFQEPETLHCLLSLLADVVADYLNAQIAAGADVVQIFDTWGGILSNHHYQQFSLQYMSRIVSKLKREVDGRTIPVILFTKNGGQWLDQIVLTGCDAIGIDWTMDIQNARKQINGRTSIQGNMDPAILAASPSVIKKEVCYILERFGKGNGHVFNLGHGITPDIDPEHVKCFIETVHEESLQYH